METQYSRQRLLQALRKSWIVGYDPRLFFEQFHAASQEAMLPPREPFSPGTEEFETDRAAALSFRQRQRKYSLPSFPDQAMADHISRERGFKYPLSQLLWEWLFFNCNLPKPAYSQMVDIYVKSAVYKKYVDDGRAPEPEAVLYYIQGCTEPYACREMPWYAGGTV